MKTFFFLRSHLFSDQTAAFFPYILGFTEPEIRHIWAGPGPSFGSRQPCPKILEFLYLRQCRFIHLQQALIMVRWNMKYMSVSTVLIFIPAVSQAVAKLFSARWRSDYLEAESNHQQIAGNWFCNFRSWHTHQLGCICRSNSCKQWRRKETKLNLARVQRLPWKALIACHLPNHKPPVGTIE